MSLDIMPLENKIAIENGISSLLFLTIPIMFELPFNVSIGFIILSISSILFHIFPTVDLFGFLDTSSVIYVCSNFSFSSSVIALSLAGLNVVEKIILGRNSPFVLMAVWIYTFIYCTIKYNIYTIIPILFSSLFYHYTYFINNSKWDNRIRVLWHFYNSLYISINIPYRYPQMQVPEIPKKLLQLTNTYIKQ